jgi:cytoskeletal protein CcmA (bactofilin family)
MSVIDQGLVVTGDMFGEDQMTVKGTVKGTIVLQKGNLEIEQTRKVEGGVFAENVLVHGEVHGNVTALTSLRVSASSKIYGNMKAAKIAIDDGAMFSGGIEIREPEPFEVNIQDFQALSEEEYEELRRWRIRNHIE